MVCYLITGAAKGLGFGFVQHLVQHDDSNRVVAAVRDKSECDKSLHELEKKYQDRLQVVHMDVAVPDSVKQAIKEMDSGKVCNGKIDVLICNAGVSTHPDHTPTKTTPDDLKSCMLVNFYGVVNATTCLLPLLEKGQEKKIFVVSSMYGSLGGPHSEQPDCAAYAVSKAAANMWSKKLAAELGPQGFTTVMFHPGSMIDTDMTQGGEKSIDSAVAECMKNIILKAGKSHNGRLLNCDGSDLPF